MFGALLSSFCPIIWWKHRSSCTFTYIIISYQTQQCKNRGHRCTIPALKNQEGWQHLCTYTVAAVKLQKFNTRCDEVIYALEARPSLNIRKHSHMYSSTYFASRTNAIVPERSGVDALVPVKSSVHLPLNVVVLCKKRLSFTRSWGRGSEGGGGKGRGEGGGGKAEGGRGRGEGVGGKGEGRVHGEGKGEGERGTLPS